MIQDVHLTTTRKPDAQIAPQLVGRCSEQVKVLIGGTRATMTKTSAKGRKDKAYDPERHREFKPQDKAASARMDAKLYPRTKPR